MAYMAAFIIDELILGGIGRLWIASHPEERNARWYRELMKRRVDRAFLGLIVLELVLSFILPKAHLSVTGFLRVMASGAFLLVLPVPMAMVLIVWYRRHYPENWARRFETPPPEMPMRVVVTFCSLLLVATIPIVLLSTWVMPK